MRQGAISEKLHSYGWLGLISLGIDLLFTRLWFPRARLIRRPIQFRGRAFIDYGTGLTTGRYCRIDALAKGPASKPLIQFGSGVQINDSVHIGAIESVTIRDHVLIASRVFISDHNHGCYSGPSLHSCPESVPFERPLTSSPILIEENVWIGESVSILPGVTIGRGSIIGAQSVVSKSVPPNCIAVGAPARVIKTYNFASSTWERV